MVDINNCYCITQIDGKYKGSSNWNCVGYGYPSKKLIPKKYFDNKKYKVCKIGAYANQKEQI